MMIVQLALTSIFAAILYLNGDTAAERVRRLARRFDGARGEDTLQLVVQAIRGVALGVIGTAFILAAFAGSGLAITGVPYAAMLTGVMLVSAVAQIGTMPVLIPAVIWLYWSGHPGWGTFLLVWTVVAGTMDNFLSPMLIKKRLDLPVLLITAGVMGGLIAFGSLGLFVGPVVLAVSYTWLVAWIQGDEPEHGPGPKSTGASSLSP
jgi:predicted PurR-regulated permease PerM